MIEKQSYSSKEKEIKLIEKIEKAKKELLRLQEKRKVEIGRNVCLGLIFSSVAMTSALAASAPPLKCVAKTNAGMYISASWGINFSRFNSVKGVTPYVLTNSKAVKRTDQSGLLGVSVGYAASTLPLRAELYYAHNRKQQFSDDITFPPNTVYTERTKVDLTQSLLLVRAFYDFYKTCKFNPYIGAGAGMAFNRISAAQREIPPNARVATFAETRHTNLALQLIAGFNVPLAKSISLGLGYSYTYTGKVRTAENCKGSDGFICDVAEYHQAYQGFSSIFANITYHIA